MKQALTTLVLLSLLNASAFAAADASDHLEMEVSLHTANESETETNKLEQTVICVVGTNDWYISGQFLKNARVEFWLTGATVVERKVINNAMYWEQAKDLISEKIGAGARPRVVGSYPKPGEIWMQTNSWLDAFGYGTERAVWLAFCSGSFLRLSDRKVPLPLGLRSRIHRQNRPVAGSNGSLSTKNGESVYYERELGLQL